MISIQSLLCLSVCLSAFCSLFSNFINVFAPRSVFASFARVRAYDTFNVYQLKTVWINLTHRLTLNEFIFIIIASFFLFLFSFCFMCSYSCVRSLLPFRSFSVLSCVRYYIHKIHVLVYGFIGWFACSYNTYVWGASTQHTFKCARNCFWWRDRQSLPLIQLFGPMQNLWTIHDTLILWNVTYLQWKKSVWLLPIRETNEWPIRLLFYTSITSSVMRNLIRSIKIIRNPVCYFIWRILLCQKFLQLELA